MSESSPLEPDGLEEAITARERLPACVEAVDALLLLLLLLFLVILLFLFLLLQCVSLHSVEMSRENRCCFFFLSVLSCSFCSVALSTDRQSSLTRT